MFAWKELVGKIKEKTREGRELVYSEGAVGITSLLYCPIKAELRQRYPDLTTDAVEVDDGYLWEGQVKEALREMFGASFEEEKVLKFEVDGLRLEGHLDTFVETDDAVYGIELKAPKMLLLKRVPEPEKIQENVLFDDGTYCFHNDIYVLQARIQKYLLEKLYPNKKVKQFLFYKALCKKGRWAKKLYVIYPVDESITDEELKTLVRRFKEDKTPRFAGECEGYCEYYRQGLCAGKPVPMPDDGKHYAELDKETQELIKDYRALQADLKSIEVMLKKRIRGTVKIGDRELGWIEKRVERLDEEKLIRLLQPEELKDYILIRWNKKEELKERFGEDIIKEVEVKREWRI